MVDWSWGWSEEAFSQFLLGMGGLTVVEEEPSFVGDHLVGYRTLAPPDISPH